MYMAAVGASTIDPTPKITSGRFWSRQRVSSSNTRMARSPRLVNSRQVAPLVKNGDQADFLHRGERFEPVVSCHVSILIIRNQVGQFIPDPYYTGENFLEKRHFPRFCGRPCGSTGIY
jgi:hypothetical protein